MNLWIPIVLLVAAILLLEWLFKYLKPYSGHPVIFGVRVSTFALSLLLSIALGICAVLQLTVSADKFNQQIKEIYYKEHQK